MKLDWLIVVAYGVMFVLPVALLVIGCVVNDLPMIVVGCLVFVAVAPLAEGL